MAWVKDCARRIQPRNVLEVGSRNVNGTARDAFPNTVWWGVDVEPGDGVDEVRDLSGGCPLEWVETFDLVVSTETFEHSQQWHGLFGAMVDAVRTGGHILVTCASPGRPEHSAVDGGPLRAGEWYRNLEPDELDHPRVRWLSTEVDVSAGDLKAFGVKW